MIDGMADTILLPQISVQAVGVARGNPGLSGAGIVVVDASGAVREHIARYLGSMTALEAQLQAMILALRNPSSRFSTRPGVPPAQNAPCRPPPAAPVPGAPDPPVHCSL